jgi:lactam utilization protein B
MAEHFQQRRSLGTPSVGQAAKFLVALSDLCQAHGVWIGHEDWHGAFEVQFASTKEWIMAARPVESFEEVTIAVPDLGERT